MIENATKICRTCGIIYPLNRKYFYIRKDTKFGFFTECILCNRRRGKVNRLTIKLECFNYYSNNNIRCMCPSGICENNYIEFLSLDHINGGGTKHRKSLLETKQCGSGDKFYLFLRRNGYPDGYRLLCHCCNQSFGYCGYCPHEREVSLNTKNDFLVTQSTEIMSG